MGRPKINDTEKKEMRLTVRFKAEDLTEIQLQADATALSVAEFIRRRALGRKIVSKADLRVLGELRRLGGLLKYVHQETRGTYSEDTRSAIQALESYAQTLERNYKGHS